MYTSIQNVKYLGNKVTKDCSVEENNPAPGLREKAFSLLSLGLTLRVGLLSLPFVRLRQSPSIPSLLSSSIKNGC